MRTVLELAVHCVCAFSERDCRECEKRQISLLEHQKTKFRTNCLFDL